MATFSVFSHFLLVCFAAFLLLSDSSLSEASAAPQSRGAAGVFLLLEGGKYTFNFTAARDACLSLNLSMASRAQMERALQRGLETCKFGWIAEQVAAVPRLTADSRCGRSKTGVVTWAASAQQTFGVYCFNASDLEDDRSTAATQTPPPAAASLRSEATPPTETPEQTSPTAAADLIRTTHSAQSPSSLKPSSTQAPPPAPPHVSTSTHVVTFPSSSSPHASSSSVPSESATTRPTGSTKAPLGDVPTALIVLAVILLLLAAAGVVWFYKLNIFTFWSQQQQKDDTETEMWKQTDSETDLQQDGDEEEADRKYSSDITLCVKSNSQQLH